MCQFLLLGLARKKASRDMFKHPLAGFQTSRVIVKHFVAGFQANRVQRVNM